MSLGTLFSDFVKAGKAVESWIVKQSGSAPKVVATVAADAGKLEPVIEAFFPGSIGAFNLLNALGDKTASAVEAAGPAAAQAGLSVPLDQTEVAAWQAAIAAAKAAAGMGSQSATAPAPAVKKA